MIRRTLIAALCCLPFLIPEHAPAATHASLPPVGPFPDAPCTLASRMDIYIGPDGTLWECVCEALKTGHACDWYDQGPVTAARTIKRAKLRLHVRSLPRMVVIPL